MFRVKADKHSAIFILGLISLLYSFWSFAYADNSTGKDVLPQVDSQTRASFIERWSRLGNQLLQQRNLGQNGFYVRDKWALLIGINHFQDNALQPMRVSRNNVLLLSSVFKERSIGRFPGEHVVTLCGRNATKDGIEEAIFNSMLIKRALPRDLIVLYFSTRMLPLRQNEDIGLCAYDTVASNAEPTSIKLIDMLSNLRKRTQSPHIVCILDCCRAAKDDQLSTNPISLEEISKKTGVCVVSASKLGEDSRVCANGIFSSFALYLSDALRNCSGTLSLGPLLGYVQDNLNGENKTNGGVMQQVSYAYPSNNTRVDIMIGAPLKGAWNPKQFTVGHSPGNIAFDRPDLIEPVRSKSTIAEQPASRTVANETSEDPEDAKFSKVDFGPWMEKMRKDINLKWTPPKDSLPKHLVTVFTVMRDGSIVNPSVAEGGGSPELQQSALEALKTASPLDPLPSGAPPSVDLRYVFDGRLSAN